MPHEQLTAILADLKGGHLVPYLGPDTLRESRDLATGEPLPATGEALILAMNGGRPMAPKLMYEFPRAAMNRELKRGRGFITRFLTDLYAKRQWSVGPLHRRLAELEPPYLIDTNRDLTLQRLYAGRPHLLIQGVARIGGTEYRFKLFQSDGGGYREVTPEEADTTLPLLFKPLGSPEPEANFIASDADFVDYITELMGGFAIPPFLKGSRKGRRYLLLGVRFTRDTERMIFSDIIQGAAEPAGWALIPAPTDKERRFCAKRGVEIVEAHWSELLAHTAAPA